MMQQELPFFWPLTEQIPLDLDHSNCLKQNILVNSIGTNGTYLDLGTTSCYISGKINFDTEQFTFTSSKKPNIVQSMLYKVMGIKLEKK